MCIFNILLFLKNMKNIFCLFFSLIFLILNTLCDKDLYKILELQRNANAADIKKKYRELSKKYHPDKNRNDPEASKKFSDIAEAYEILSDPKKRRSYDRGGMDAVNNSNQVGEHDPFDIFGNLFGGGRRQGEKRDSDVRIKLRASLKDLYLGKEQEVYNIYI